MTWRIMFLIQSGWQPFDAVLNAFAQYLGPPADRWLWSMMSTGMPAGIDPPDYGPIW